MVNMMKLTPSVKGDTKLLQFNCEHTQNQLILLKMRTIFYWWFCFDGSIVRLCFLPLLCRSCLQPFACRSLQLKIIIIINNYLLLTSVLSEIPKAVLNRLWQSFVVIACTLWDNFFKYFSIYRSYPPKYAAWLSMLSVQRSHWIIVQSWQM